MVITNTQVQVVCPKCSAVYMVDMPTADHDAVKEKGIITAAIFPPCGHASQVFIDTK